MKIKISRKNAGTAFSYVLVLFIVIAVIYTFTCSVKNKIPFIFGRSVMTVTTESMKDTIPVGEYFLIKKVSAKDIEVGDIIVFRSSDPDIFGRLNTHRVKRIFTDENGKICFITKGDNNPTEDAYSVSEDNLEAKYVKKLPWVSKISAFFKKSGMFALLIVLPSIAIFLMSIKQVVRKSREAKADKLIAAEVERLKQENEKTKSE